MKIFAPVSGLFLAFLTVPLMIVCAFEEQKTSIKRIICEIFIGVNNIEYHYKSLNQGTHLKINVTGMQNEEDEWMIKRDGLKKSHASSYCRIFHYFYFFLCFVRDLYFDTVLA